MAITGGLDYSPLPLARTRRRAPLPLPYTYPCCLRLGDPSRLRRTCRASLATAPAPIGDEPRKSPLDLALLLAAAAAAAAAASPHAALAASGGAMGGRSYSSSSRSSSTSSSSSSFSSSSRSSPSSSSSSSSSSWSSPSSSSTSASSWSTPSSSTSSSPEQQAEAIHHVSVGTARPPPVATAAQRDADMRFWGYLASASVTAAALFLAARHYTRPRTTVVKLQVLQIFPESIS